MRFWQSVMYLDLLFLFVLVVTDMAQHLPEMVFWGLVFLTFTSMIFDLIAQELEVSSKERLNAVIDGEHR